MYLFHWKKVNTQWLRTQALDLDKEEHIKQHKLTPGQQFTYFLMPIPVSFRQSFPRKDIYQLCKTSTSQAKSSKSLHEAINL